MRKSPRETIGQPRPLHPHAWLWEPLSREPTFVVRSMFGAKAIYLDGRMVLCFCAGDEPWRGVLVCTDHSQHPALVAEFPALSPHSILPKWLYLPEAIDAFERIAQRLVSLVRGRDPRIGIAPKPGKKKSPARRAKARLRGRP
jgi:hypothetical protein